MWYHLADFAALGEKQDAPAALFYKRSRCLFCGGKLLLLTCWASRSLGHTCAPFFYLVCALGRWASDAISALMLGLIHELIH